MSTFIRLGTPLICMTVVRLNNRLIGKYILTGVTPDGSILKTTKLASIPWFLQNSDAVYFPMFQQWIAPRPSSKGMTRMPLFPLNVGI